MSWRRLPACLPNLPIRLVPLTEPAQKAYEATGFVKQLVFKTVPSVGKLEIREYLRSVYNLDVSSVRTLIAQGKKKRGKHGHYRRPDVKKAFVTLKGQGPSSSQGDSP